MYVYYVCLLLLSEFNKCWREWSHTDNEIDENQKNNCSHQKIQLLRFSVVVRGMGEWGKTSYANIKNVLHSFSLVKTDNQFQCVRQKASLSFSFIRTKTKKKLRIHYSEPYVQQMYADRNNWSWNEKIWRKIKTSSLFKLIKVTRSFTMIGLIMKTQQPNSF